MRVSNMSWNCVYVRVCVSVFVSVCVCVCVCVTSVPFIFCLLVEQFLISTRTCRDWKIVRAEQSNSEDGYAKVGI